MGKKSKIKHDRATQQELVDFFQSLAPNIEDFSGIELEDYQLLALNFAELNMRLIARAWESKRLMEDDPLAPFRDEEIITPARYRWIWAYVDMQWLLWELVQVAEPLVKQFSRKAKTQYPFKRSIELFMEIVSSQVEDQNSTIFRDHYNFSAPQLEKFCRSVPRLLNSELSESEKTKIVYIAKRTDVNRELWSNETQAFRKNPIFYVLMHCCEGKEGTVGDRFNRFKESMSSVYDAQATMLRNMKSFSITNGQLKMGQQAGGTYR